MVALTDDLLRGIAPGGKQTHFRLFKPLADEMNAQFPGAGIDTIQEVRHFLAQAACETNSFNTMIEYDSGDKYEMRRDLGNTMKGWGVKYKGRGIFDTTGYTNYKRLTDICPDKQVSFLIHPELLELPHWAVWSALVFWNDRKLSDFANQPDSALIYSKTLDKQLTPVQYITYRINGGQNGIDQREMFYDRAKKLIA